MEVEDSFQPAVESKLPSWTKVTSSSRHPPLFWRCAAASDGCPPLKHKKQARIARLHYFSVWKRTPAVMKTFKLSARLWDFYSILFLLLGLSPAMIVAMDAPVSSPLKAPSSRMSGFQPPEQPDSTFLHRRLLKTHTHVPGTAATGWWTKTKTELCEVWSWSKFSVMLLLIIQNVIIILRDYNCFKMNFNSSEFAAVFMRGKWGKNVLFFWPISNIPHKSD